jgi:hypothetical protein
MNKTVFKRSVQCDRVFGRGRNGTIRVVSIEIYRYPALDEVIIAAYSRIRTNRGQRAQAPLLLRGTTADMRQLSQALTALLNAREPNRIESEVKREQSLLGIASRFLKKGKD